MAWVIRYRDAEQREWTLPPIRSEQEAMNQTRILSQYREDCEIIDVRTANGIIIRGERLPRRWTEVPQY